MTSTGISDLPQELMQRIVSEDIPLSDVLRLCETNRLLNRRLCSDPYFWIALARKRLTSKEEILSDLSDDNIYQLKVSLIKLEKPITPLAYFAGNGYEIAVRRLIQVTPLEEVKHALRAAAKMNQRDIIELILQEAPHIPNPKLQMITGAIQGGNLELFEELFPEIEVNMIQRLYRIAGRENQRNIIDYLLMTAPTQEGINSALGGAIENNHREMFDYLLPRADLNGINDSLFSAAVNDHREYLPLLLPRASRETINRALRLAVGRGNIEIAEYLLPHVEQNARNDAFLAAVGENQENAFNLLLPEIFEQSVFDEALYRAVYYKSIRFIRELVPRTSEEGKKRARQVARHYKEYKALQLINDSSREES